MSLIKSKLTNDDIREFVPHEMQPVSGLWNVLEFDMSHSYALRDCDGHLICMAGFVPSNPCWSFFGVFSENFLPRHIPWMRLAFLEEFDNIGIDRAEHYVMCEHIYAVRIGKLMGAELEGIKKKYYNGKDYAILAVVK